MIAERADSPGVTMAAGGHADLPQSAEKNASGIAAIAVLERAGARDVGVRLTLEKRLPLSGGQGVSAASTVAGAVAVNRLLGESARRDRAVRVRSAVAESQLSGRHGDNLASALFGGVILVRSLSIRSTSSRCRCRRTQASCSRIPRSA